MALTFYGPKKDKSTFYSDLPKDPINNTLSPVTTGSSVVALTFKDGVMLGADCQVSYGSLSKYRDIQRL